jgi:hypothetical protein
LCGATQGPLGGRLKGVQDPWLARFDGAGNQLWLLQGGSTALDTAYAVAPDGAGGVFVAGETNGDMGFGGQVGSQDAWVVRFDAAGNGIWGLQLGTAAEELVFAAAEDGAGGVYLVGHTTGVMGSSSFGSHDAWVARFDAAGNQAWVRQYGSSQVDYAFGAAPDGAGGVYLVGQTFAALAGTFWGGSDAWLAHYDGAGTQRWARQLGSTGFDDGRAAAAYVAGGVYVAGSTDGNLGGPLLGPDDAFLARYDAGCGGGPATYCTAKVASTGILASIGWSGTPSWGGQGFALACFNGGVPKTMGIYIYSDAGPAAHPFANATLCLASPVRRGPAHQYDGIGIVYAPIQIGLAQVGKSRWYQFWFSDPKHPDGTGVGLSDGLEVTFCP